MSNVINVLSIESEQRVSTLLEEVRKLNPEELQVFMRMAVANPSEKQILSSDSYLLLEIALKSGFRLWQVLAHERSMGSESNRAKDALMEDCLADLRRAAIKFDLEYVEGLHAVEVQH